MSVGFHDCPKCGAKGAAHGDNFCGRCESDYHAEQDRLAQDEIADLEQQNKACPCDKTESAGCYRCTMRYVQILTLQGKEDKAHQLLNQ